MLNSLAEVLSAVIALSDSLIRRCRLDVILPDHIHILSQVVQIALDCICCHVGFLVHETEVQIDRTDFWVVISRNHFEQSKGSVHVFKSSLDVSTAVIIHGQRGVREGYMRVVKAKQSFLQHYRFGLQLNCLQEVAKLELDARYFRDAVCHLLVHRA